MRVRGLNAEMPADIRDFDCARRALTSGLEELIRTELSTSTLTQ